MRRDTLEALRDAQADARAVVLATALDGSAQRLLFPDALGGEPPAVAEAVRGVLASDRADVIALDGVEWLLAPHNTPLRLVIVGAVHISEFLCPMARMAGYDVTVVDPRAAFLRPDRFPDVTRLDQWPQQAFPALKPDARTAVVLLTHDPKIDDPALECVLGTPAFYVGALGSTRTHGRRLERLAAAGLSPQQLARIHGPAGLPIGARTPAEIAVSVLAEMTQVLRRAGA
ncbi:MAG: hypothetical protein RLZZ200_1481 [Pseudomonadota bacterium]|jgi:xanthine dehydrogenase accessory factor